jgi:hypothetical protein
MDNLGQLQTEQELIADFKLKVLKKANEFATMQIDYADSREIKDWVDIVSKLNSFEVQQVENKIHVLLERVGVKFQNDL